MMSAGRGCSKQPPRLLVVVLLWAALSLSSEALLQELPEEAVTAFRAKGYATIRNALTEQEVAELDEPFEFLMNGTFKEEMRRDFTDMSKPWDAPFDTWSVVNGMLPTRYHAAFRNTAWTRQAKVVADALFPDLEFDYDQLLDKRPGKADAVFAMHQDMVYWPPAEWTADKTTTVTATLYLDDADEANGCLRFVPGSHRSGLRKHVPLSGSRDEGHALVTDVGPDETVELAPTKRGDITIHDEWVVHGSGGNTSPNRTRRTYVIAFRHRDVVRAERNAGFTHSHNDNVNWDSFRTYSSEGASSAVRPSSSLSREL